MTKWRGSYNKRMLLCRSLSLPLVQYNHTERRYPMKIDLVFLFIGRERYTTSEEFQFFLRAIASDSEVSHRIGGIIVQFFMLSPFFSGIFPHDELCSSGRARQGKRLTIERAVAKKVEACKNPCCAIQTSRPYWVRYP